jgi:hypothetical protein
MAGKGRVVYGGTTKKKLLALYNPNLLLGQHAGLVGAPLRTSFLRGGLGLDLGKGLEEPEHAAKLGKALIMGAAQNAPLGGAVVAVVSVGAVAVGAVLAGVPAAVALAVFTLAVALPVLFGLPEAIGAFAFAVARTADVVKPVNVGRSVAAPERVGALVVLFLAPTAPTVAVVTGPTPAVLERKRRVGGVSTALADAGFLLTHGGLLICSISLGVELDNYRPTARKK